MRSIAALMSMEISLPDFSTLSRRGKVSALPSAMSETRTSGPIHLVVDSTGLKIFDEANGWKTSTKPSPDAKDGANFTLVSILSAERLFAPI